MFSATEVTNYAKVKIMLVNRLCFVSMLLLSAPLLFGQPVTISGVVRDTVTLQPLDSARITITNTNNPSERYTVFTNTQGLWAFTFTGGTSVGEDLALPELITVEPNYPNPFNPSTVLRFTIRQGGTVRVSIYTVLGEELARETFALEPGGYTLPWTSKGAAGALFYAFEVRGQRITGKMLQLDGGTTGGLGAPTMVHGIGSTGHHTPSSSSTYVVIAERYDYEPDSLTIPQINNANINFQLNTVHRRAFVFDLHNDVLGLSVNGYQLGERHTTNHSDIPRFRDGGIDAQMLSVWVSPTQFPTTSYARAMQMIDSFLVQLDRNGNALAQARTTAEIQAAHAGGRIAGVLGIEGGHIIENDVNKLVTLYNRGARYLTITWNNSTAWATSAADPQSATRGLSDLGRNLIRKMDTLGMLIDVSHTGIKTIEDILQVSSNPIIASHSGVRALRNHTRNLTDAQILSLAQRGGVIGVVFYPPFLSSSSMVTVDTVVKHIDYLKNLVGVDYIALGSDFDGIEQTPLGLEDVTKVPAITAALLRRGYSRADVRKILGENYLRVFRAVCR